MSISQTSTLGLGDGKHFAQGHRCQVVEEGTRYYLLKFKSLSEV